MTITWEAFRNTVRRTILRDSDPNAIEPDWSDELLRDATRWALNTFCSHTALFQSARYDKNTVKIPGDSPVYYDMTTDTDFVLPLDVFEDVEISALVCVTNGTERYYIDPLNHTPRVSPRSNPQGFRLLPGNTIRIENVVLTADTQLTIDYFAYYPSPEVDGDLLLIPRWAETALAYLVGAHCMSSAAVSSANINQWKNREDSGTPEHNAFRVMQDQFLKLYERELARYPLQERLQMFRNLR
jgi:hypothetical protein